MKSKLNLILRIFIVNKYLWNICLQVMRLAEWFRYEKSCYEHGVANKKLQLYFNDLIVRDGFLKGLKYPNFNSSGSSIFPKLSGTYENELVPIFHKLKPNTYDLIVDIGSAEGFYANGLALQYPEAIVYAFDIDPVARQSCYDMAVLNNVEKRVKIQEACNSNWFKFIDLTKRSLIICDCEGFERELFITANTEFFIMADLIIELHPMYDKNIKNDLLTLFSQTHNIQFVSSYDDRRKIFDLPIEYNSFTDIEKIMIVQEGRAFTMEWMIAVHR